ncbi:MAG: DUF1553 domain-containing protein [Planctomycetota bacterium]
MLRFLFCILCVLNAMSKCRAEGLSRRQRDLFENHVRPTFVAHCISCHGPKKQEGGLQLTSLAGLIEGGDSGPTIVPGKPNDSVLMEALRYESLEMPPEGPLEKKSVDGIAEWIAAGAPWPEDVMLSATPKLTDEDRDWWCYQPLNEPEVPATIADDVANPIDAFIRQRLSESGLKPAPQADPLMLARRVHYAIVGLPPDQETVDSALSGSFDYETLIERLLESEEYGKNQAKFWLDLVRYAETDGYRADFDRPKAHLYRDYVIRSFNEDKPYDRFIMEQLAGDEIDPGNGDALTATMYLRHWIYEHNQRDVETQWHEILSDITETTSDVFLAQGLKCARCHDHKFDPLLQKDFFRFKAFFAAFQPTESHPVADIETLTEYRQRLNEWATATLAIRKRLRDIEHPVLLEHATREGFEKFIPKIKQMIRKWPDDREPYEAQIASLAARQYDLPRDEIEKWLTDEQKQERSKLLQQLADFEKQKPEPLTTMEFVASDVGPIAPATFIPDDATETPIKPGFLSLLSPEPASIARPHPSLRSTGRRTALAQWIASPDNPLTARVIVNRVWQQHFGRGLVETASDFGRLGTPPSHPELLDWLALRFIEDGWSLKKLHRRILTTATYRQTSLQPANEVARNLDPGNRLLWRMRPRRLSGEEVNDAILAASGELSETKRAIYKPVKRNSPDPLLAAFDGPDRIRSMGLRHRTTTSNQALLMGNGSWTHQRATEIAGQLAADSSPPEEWMTRLYRTLFARLPTANELQLGMEFLERYTSQTPKDEPPVSLFATMPATGANAIFTSPDHPVDIKLTEPEIWPRSDVTIEAIVQLNSLYEDATVRTIVAQWTGSRSKAGWSFGVTSTKSAFQPRNLILQLIGKRRDDEALHYEVIASNLRPQLNRPYYLAVSIDLDDTSKDGIRFYMKDLSDPNAKLQVAGVSHSVTNGIAGKSSVTVGGRHGSHQWDGLIDSLRVEPVARDLAVTPQADSEEGLPDYVIDWQFEDTKRLGFDSSGREHHAEAVYEVPKVVTPRDHARVALVHALLNSNEFIYVD